ncbi:multicopper oxidase family protein [Yinghuangia seranimata]|uniref:multicopper oxidase family protein n=1 Tax=Yinghuangia seranimata TaxID=408067 RepID=UPI00248CA8B2|nr:multicopper oxidase family protein [Yinghuangia seranimata]MDI2128986.1 multicopper oxidase family protein [Yinghuangia seranimata]
MLTRRAAAKAGALAGGLVLSGWAPGRAFAAAAPGPPTRRRSAEPRALPPPFTVPLAVPVDLAPSRSTADTDHYRLSVGRSTTEIVPGVATPVLTYNGTFPGPTLRARTGRRTVVTTTNLLDGPVSMHLHGGQVSADNDGQPMDPVQPWSTRGYTYENTQAAATLWYHDHAHMAEAENVYRGMAGFYLLEDDGERELGLPTGEFDVPLMIRDVHLDDNAELVYIHDDFAGRSTHLVNGGPQPYFEVAARRYRFRVLNGANLCFYTLHLSTGDDLVQIGSDRGLLAAPAPQKSIMLSPGERADVVVDFGRYPVGTRVVLRSASRNATLDLMAFDVTAEACDPSRVPASLATLPPPGAASVTRDMVFEKTGDTWTINGRTYDPMRVDTEITWGSTEIWRVVNKDHVAHNMHLHLVHFRVLDRNGRPPDPGESGLKDTVRVMPGETVRIQATFDTWTGRYPYHCHLLDHSAMGMMATMEITR